MVSYWKSQAIKKALTPYETSFRYKRGLHSFVNEEKLDHQLLMDELFEEDDHMQDSPASA